MSYETTYGLSLTLVQATRDYFCGDISSLTFYKYYIIIFIENQILNGRRLRT